jgi:hypothetical protein
MISDQNYFRPKPDPRVYEDAIEKATFLTDNMYIQLTSGYTFETLVNDLINKDNSILEKPGITSISQK